MTKKTWTLCQNHGLCLKLVEIQSMTAPSVSLVNILTINFKTRLYFTCTSSCYFISTAKRNIWGQVLFILFLKFSKPFSHFSSLYWSFQYSQNGKESINKLSISLIYLTAFLSGYLPLRLFISIDIDQLYSNNIDKKKIIIINIE